MSSSPVRRAACACGQLSVVVTGEPIRVSVCHCLDCQRRTGAPFGQQARWAKENVSALQGQAKQFVRTGDEGRKITFNFCPDCGSTVTYMIDDQPDIVAVPVGAFADPAFPPPARSVYNNRRHAWVMLPDNVARLD